MPMPAGAAEFRGRVYDSIVDTIGAAPLVQLKKFAASAGVAAGILAKCERPGIEGRVTAVLPDFAERYVSTARFEGL